MKYLDSEFKNLKEVILYLPPTDWYVENPEDYFFINKVSFLAIHTEISALKKAYEANGVKVHVISNDEISLNKTAQLYNMIYVRDLFFMTPEGAIIANMGIDIRKSEPRHLEELLKKLNIPILKVMQDEAEFEGADALYINKKLVVVGVGRRTNWAGFLALQEILSAFKIQVIPIEFKLSFPQHLLGLLQIVGENLALVRYEIIDKKMIDLLIENHFFIINVPEKIILQEPQSMNIVCLGDKKVIMPNHCPKMEKILLTADIEIAHRADIASLMCGGGGIACATGILSRLM